MWCIFFCFCFSSNMFLYIMQICFAIYEPILMIVELGGKKHHFKQSNLLWIDQSLIHLLRELYRSMRVHRHWMMHSVTSHTVVDILRLIFYKWNTRWRLVCAHLAIIITFRSNVALNVAKTHHKNDICVCVCVCEGCCPVLKPADWIQLRFIFPYYANILFWYACHLILYCILRLKQSRFQALKASFFLQKRAGLPSDHSGVLLDSSLQEPL